MKLKDNVAANLLYQPIVSVFKRCCDLLNKKTLRHILHPVTYHPSLCVALKTQTASDWPVKRHFCRSSPRFLLRLLSVQCHTLSNGTHVCSCQHDRWPRYWLEVNSEPHCWVRWRISIRVVLIRMWLKRKLFWVTCPDAPLLQQQTTYIFMEELWVRISKIQYSIHLYGFRNTANLSDMFISTVYCTGLTSSPCSQLGTTYFACK